MPESTCGQCNNSKWLPTTEGLMRWELAHHKSSFKKAKPGSLATANGIEGFHDCRSFTTTDEETGMIKTLRIYNYNMLVETKEY